MALLGVPLILIASTALPVMRRGPGGCGRVERALAGLWNLPGTRRQNKDCILRSGLYYRCLSRCFEVVKAGFKPAADLPYIRCVGPISEAKARSTFPHPPIPNRLRERARGGGAASG